MNDRNDPYAEGLEAHDCGLPETANPYDDTTDDFMSWNDGWLFGREQAGDHEDEAATRSNDGDGR